ncbi:MAG: ATP-binding cassette domain-containing protein [Holosporales bacterium]|jgi:putative ABC transport system ATP-binding protein|nr:ATP-binding cassette domain-containing protein [Holosporales bacterium]
MLNIIDLSVRDVLQGLNLAVKPKELVLVVGANGSGKTTLFNTILGAVKPTKGKIVVNGKDVTNIPQYKRVYWISSVLQDPRSGSIGKMTILENMSLAYMRRGYKRISNKIVNYFKEKLSILEMGLEYRLSERVENLSGGQRQALSLTMSIADDCNLLLLDEITSALDPKSSAMVMKITDKIVKYENKTCLLITHDIKHINSFNGRIFEMKNGKLVATS